MVFQNYALFPHLSVFDNLAFGLKARKRPKEEIEQEFISLDAVENDNEDEDFDNDENLVDMDAVSGAMRDAFGE